MKCRILYLVGQLRAGGLERQLCYLLGELDRGIYKPAVAVWNFSELDVYVSRIRALGVPLYGLSGASFSATKLKAFRSLVMDLQPEIVHSYTFFTNTAAWWGTLRTKALVFGSVRSDFAWAQQESGFLKGKLSSRWPRTQIFNNFTAARRAIDCHSLFAPAKCFVVRNGVDLHRYHAAALPETKSALVLGIGSLFPVKRWDRLLRASSQLQRRNLDFVVRLVGGGPLRPHLEGLANQLGLNGRVRFEGHVDDVITLLRDTTFLVHTSDSEGCPNVVMEAMACGRAVVATAVGDVPSLMEDGITGFVVRCGDDAALVERMATLITDRDLCRRMGEAGRAKAEREFGLDHLVTETLSAYRAAGWMDS